MAPFIFFAALFLCGLLNAYFFPPSALSAWLKSRLCFSKKTSKPAAPTSKSRATAPPAKDEEKDLDAVFSTFDSDGDGFITLRELEASLARLQMPVTREEARGMMERADANGDGLIDVDEFRKLYSSSSSSADGASDLKEAFEAFDGNRDGVITVEELGEALVSMGLRRRGEVEAEDCRDMIRRVDLDGDGKVDFEEFKSMMMMVS